MANESFKQELIEWLEQHSYWLQFAGQKILDRHLTQDEVDKTFNLFLEDHGLAELVSEREEVVFSTVQLNGNVHSEITLESIKDIENVNALATGQEIPIHKNMTIIYGANGVGKSGYVRMLNNSFKSRGDKNILSNVFDTSKTGSPTCKFVYNNSTNSYELKFPAEKNSFEFSQFSVYDTECAKAHLEQENGLFFTPSGFEFFNKILSLFESLRLKLDQEISKCKVKNDFLPLFVNNNLYTEQIGKLNHSSNESELQSLANFTHEDQTALDKLNDRKAELNSLDIAKRITELQKVESQLKTFLLGQNAIMEILAPEKIDNFKTLINKYHEFLKLSTDEGIKSLEHLKIPALGSPEWKQFISSAKTYVKIIETNGHSVNYPSSGDNCVFCLQPLAGKENDLVKAYWALLKSEAEAELNRIIKAIKDAEKTLKGIAVVVFDETTTLFSYVSTIDNDLAQKWKNIVSSCEISKRNIIQNLVQRNLDAEVSSSSDLLSEFDKISEKIKSEITDLINKNPAKELEEIEKQIKLLTDKSLMKKLLDQILSFVKAHKWAYKAEQSASSLRTNSLTSKQGTLFSTHITEKYTELFNSECRLLKAPAFVNINQRNTKGQTLRKLQVQGQVANKVLSEGEQRAISLADFLTEAQMDENNRGIIFDDPVTSLDHERKELIAERLVLEASKRQVIIFTHDIPFLIQLQIIAERLEIGYRVTTVRKVGDRVGIVNPQLPWVAQKVKDRIGYLKNDLVRLEKLEKEGSDEYAYAIKSWYGLLRETWERSVEERLFKGVVERFAVGVQTQKLKKVIINEEILNEIELGMTDSSKWIHDSAAGLNPTIPDTKVAGIHLKNIDEFAKKCIAP